MPRPKRAADAGLIYHVHNRSNLRSTIFANEEDYVDFERVLEQAVERTQSRLLAYCLLPDHWHLVIWPRVEGELSRFTGWLTLTHTQRWHSRHQSIGTGHLYQGRFKSFPVQADGHLLSLCRYVERNSLRAQLVERAEQWRWSSLYRWSQGTNQETSLIARWPRPRRPGWLEHVNAPQAESELTAIRHCVQRGSPFGDPDWTAQIVRQLGLESTQRPRGRPRKLADS